MMTSTTLRERPTREQLVEVQYADPRLVTEYSAAFEGEGPTARYHASRLHVVDEALRRCPEGALLDVGCGPGVMVRHLLDTRPGDFDITACDRSAAMIDAVAGRAGPGAGVALSVADVEDMPFPDGSFDVALAMGVLEYVDAAHALREIARVVRPGGLVVATMLNPASPYRLFEWGVLWPARRAAGGVERLVGVPRRHGARRTGIQALRAPKLRQQMWRVGLQAEDVVFYDVTSALPPFDRFRRDESWRHHPERTVSRGGNRWLGTAYLVSARRADG